MPEPALLRKFAALRQRCALGICPGLNQPSSKAANAIKPFTYSNSSLNPAQFLPHARVANQERLWLWHRKSAESPGGSGSEFSPVSFLIGALVVAGIIAVVYFAGGLSDPNTLVGCGLN
jgi:hypothetical protein